MKYIFIINPAAGKSDNAELITQKVSRVEGLDYQLQITSAPGQGTELVREICRNHPDEQLCFIACGGDGTINEVANGVAGHENAAMSVIPVGSGNDFVKCLGGRDVFLDPAFLKDGREVRVDLIRVNDRYAVNAVHFGFDTVVLKTMIKVKRKPIIGGSNAYYTGVIRGFFTGLRNKGIIRADGVQVNDGEFMMCTICNGTHVGGSFNSAPRSKVNDGLAEVCCFRVIPRIKIPFLIGKYINGTHLEDKECLKYLKYCRAEKVEIDAPQGMDISVDGELVSGTHFDVSMEKQAIRFIIPQKGADL